MSETCFDIGIGIQPILRLSETLFDFGAGIKTDSKSTSADLGIGLEIDHNRLQRAHWTQIWPDLCPLPPLPRLWNRLYADSKECESALILETVFGPFSKSGSFF